MRTVTTETRYIMWGLNLTQDDHSRLQEYAGPRFLMKNWPGKKLPSKAELESEHPILVWIPSRVWKSISPRRRSMFYRDSGVQSVLLLDHEYKIEELESAFEAGSLEVVKYPLKKENVLTVLNRAIEIKNLYSDIYRMTQEIYLERELLARKNEHLTFINQFLARATESLDTISILNRAREDLDLLLPVTLLQGAVWRPSGELSMVAELFLAAGNTEAMRQEWIELLLQSANKLADRPVSDYTIAALREVDAGPDGKGHGPHPGRVVILPLLTGNETFGCLVMLAENDFRLGRDQVEILHSAVKHLGLALKNAMLYSEIKKKAQFDGLTTLYNREHFDGRLSEELTRHQRYSQPLSMMLLDLDHFKRINDTYGHQTGDHVLREMGKTLRETARNTDYVARYGGEEFVVLLPHTDEAQAWILAERLRLKIAKKRFRHDGRSFQVTSSIGMATLRPGSLKARADLVKEADKALYLAKANGRNMVFISPQEDAIAAQG